MNVYNNDGTQRMQKQIVNGVATTVPVTMTVPSYQVAFPGGDTNIVGNFEYRIPIVGPVTLALFFDAGIDKLLSARAAEAESGPHRSVERRISAGRLQRPGVHRARHPETSRVHRSGAAGPDAGGQCAVPRLLGLQSAASSDGYLQPPIVADQSYFPNNATYQNALASIGQRYPVL